jgi:predicted DNA binding CopG/RHH family protein
VRAARTFTDPFDEMTDDELDDYVEKLFRAREQTVAVSLRIAPDLLSRVKRQAARAGTPYQTFMKGVLEAGIARLERGSLKRKPRSRPAARSR